MAMEEQVTQAMFRAIDEVNRSRAPGQRVEKSRETELLGGSSVLDSLGLVNLIVAVEAQVEDAFGVTVNLADEQARRHPANPFRTIGSLADYVSALLKDQGHGA